MKEDAISYLETFEKAGIHKFGYTESVSISDIRKDVLSAQFILVNDDVFSESKDKSRRSAFYEKGVVNPRIFINKKYPPHSELIVHEILQDQHYEFSIAMSTLYDELSKAQKSSDSVLTKVYSASANLMFDSFGVKSKYQEKWVGSNELIHFENNNSTLSDDGGEGGDVSGGGGDEYSFYLKKDVLKFVLQKVSAELQKEFPNMSESEQEDFLSRSYVSLLRNIFIDTEYNVSSKIEFSVVPGSSSFNFDFYFRMVPYFIKVPVSRERTAVIQEVSDVILQSMFGQMTFVSEEYFSPCSCVDGKRQATLRCPNSKMHPSLHKVAQILQKNIEDEHRCKIRSNP